MNGSEEEIISESLQQKDLRRRKILMFISALFMLCLIVSSGSAAVAFITVRNAAQDGAELAQQIQSACVSGQAIDSELAQFCPKASDIVESAPKVIQVKAIPGPQGETGPPPTSEQVYFAVQRYCSNTKECNGKNGRNATAAQVAVAVAAYCDSKGDCLGRTGKAGRDGSGATEAQIIAAVTSFCRENDNCQGPTGKDGSNSTVPGPPGVVEVIDDCEEAEPGQVITDVTPEYDEEKQVVTISCSYRPDQTGLIN